jgi:type II secretory pathway component PulF
MYPAIVITLMFVVIFILMIFVIPQLSRLYDSLGVTLPLVTRIVVGVSSMIGKIWFLLVGFFGVFIYGFIRWKRTPTGREIYDKNILRLPLFGRIMR